MCFPSRKTSGALLRSRSCSAARDNSACAWSSAPAICCFSCSVARSRFCLRRTSRITPNSTSPPMIEPYNRQLTDVCCTASMHRLLLSPVAGQLLGVGLRLVGAGVQLAVPGGFVPVGVGPPAQAAAFRLRPVGLVLLQPLFLVAIPLLFVGRLGRPPGPAGRRLPVLFAERLLAPAWPVRVAVGSLLPDSGIRWLPQAETD